MSLATAEISRRSTQPEVTPFTRGERWRGFLQAFAVVVLCSATLRAADIAPPANEPDELAAFMKKWSAEFESAMEMPNGPKERALLLRALVADPKGPWVYYLQGDLAVSRYQLRNAPPEKRKEIAVVPLQRLREADAAIAKAMGGKLDRDLAAARGELLPVTFYWSIEAGENLAALRPQAEQLLTKVQAEKDWNQGNVIYSVNESLGRAALREGRLEDARRHLRAAGKTPGSPQLNTFGPDFVLARELLERGAKEDRETVLSFLKDVERFWADPGLNEEASSRRMAADHLDQLNSWREEIREGRIPSDIKWR